MRKRGRNFGNNVLKNIYKKLNKFAGDFNYTPNRRVLAESFEEDYNMFGTLWNNIRDEGLDKDFTKQTNLSEWQYLLEQIEMGNGWARPKIKLSISCR